MAGAALLLGLPGSAHASPAFDAARRQFEQHHFQDAEAALRKVLEEEPGNAAACHFLGRALLARIPIEKPKEL